MSRPRSIRVHGAVPRRVSLPAGEPLEDRRLMSVNVTTYHYDNARDGANTHETALTTADVNSTSFGKVASLPVDGQVYAQPLVMTGVAVPGQGTHDLVLVATEADDVYAFDAAGNDPAQGYLWRTSLLKPGETTVPQSDYGTTDITAQIGITGTPVVDPKTGTLYVVGAFKEADGTYRQRLYALDVATGAAKFGGPVTIAASVAGDGVGSVDGRVAFDPFRENQRPALTLANGQVYVGWASHGDEDPWHGWVMGYDAATLEQRDVYNDTPDGDAGGVWMSGGGIAVDAEGNLYFTNGNGTFDADAGGPDLAMAVEKLSPTLAVEDYFSPYDEAALSDADLDYGCSSVVLLPTQSGADPDQILTESKWGTMYLNDGDTGHLGEFDARRPTTTCPRSTSRPTRSRRTCTTRSRTGTATPTSAATRCRSRRSPSAAAAGPGGVVGDGPRVRRRQRRGRPGDRADRQLQRHQGRHRLGRRQHRLHRRPGRAVRLRRRRPGPRCCTTAPRPPTAGTRAGTRSSSRTRSSPTAGCTSPGRTP